VNTFRLAFRGNKDKLEAFQHRLNQIEEIKSSKVEHTEASRPNLLDRNSFNEVELIDVVIVFVLNKGFDSVLSQVKNKIGLSAQKEGVEGKELDPEPSLAGDETEENGASA
jgi:hypothetical protein